MKHLGKHPCPRCLVKTEDISALGKDTDAEFRLKSARKDNSLRQKLVQKARKEIYDNRRAIVNSEVSRLLDNQSLTPVEVRFAND